MPHVWSFLIDNLSRSLRKRPLTSQGRKVFRQTTENKEIVIRRYGLFANGIVSYAEANAESLPELQTLVCKGGRQAEDPSEESAHLLFHATQHSYVDADSSDFPEIVRSTLLARSQTISRKIFGLHTEASSVFPP